MKRSILFLLVTFSVFIVHAQTDRWQQRVKYTMDIDMNVETNRFTGKQKLEYWNNSPDTLKQVFYHLYWNAFQPNSMMDVRSRRQGTIQIGRNPDWDSRVKDRIQHLNPDEIGYQQVKSLRMNGRNQQFEVHETILQVELDRPIAPHSKATFEMDFEAQVPLQVRRSGRDNPNTKVRYSMSQWYPKMAEYDADGWHPNPYVGREFYGVWGDFNVNISIDRNYIIGGTGYLQNANQIGYGYEARGTRVARPAGKKLTWKFSAPDVHDFMWAADPEFVHRKLEVRKDLTLHLLYKPTTATAQEWEEVLDLAARALPFMEKNFGKYTYKQFTFLHGGDGGMEYPMATLLVAPGPWLHEWLHNWYHGLLATNESLYPWMDEGFTSWAEERVSAYLTNDTGFAQKGNYASYFALARSPREEPLTTHADHYNTNAAYGAAAYSKGAVFVEQLGYITGAEQRDKIMLKYYDTWKFKHPNVNDFIRVAEKVSGLQLDWYQQYWVNSIKTIDYAFDSLWEEGGKTKIRLKRVGLMPMPIDFRITFKDGSSEMHYIPLDLMYGAKPAEDDTPRKVYPAWKWTHEKYVIETDRRLSDISVAEIDPSQRMADVERKDNKLKLDR